MAFKNRYLTDLMDKANKRNAGEAEFLQAMTEVFESIEPVLEARTDLVQEGIMERMIEPERQIIFRIHHAARTTHLQQCRPHLRMGGCKGPQPGKHSAEAVGIRALCKSRTDVDETAANSDGSRRGQ